MKFAPVLALLCVSLNAQPVEVADTAVTSFPAEHLLLVSAESPAGRLVFRPSTDSSIHVTTIRSYRGDSEEEARLWLEHIETRADVDGGTVLALKAWLGELPGAEASFEVLVPPGRQVIGLLDSGSVEVDDVEGFVNLRVGAGTVSARKTRGGLDIDCGSGEVAARACRGTVELKVGTGSLTCTVAALEPGNRVELTGETGPALLYLPAGGPADLEISTGAGEVEVEDLAPDYETREPTLIRARLGAGGVPVTVRVGAGNIRVVGR